MAALLRLLEACLLVAMGTFMAVLSQSTMYWQFMNPRYSWLTLATGTMLVVVGIGSLLNTARKRHVSELAGILAFLVLVVAAFTTTPFLAEELPSWMRSLTSETPAPSGGLTAEYPDEPDPTVVYDGVEYIRINIAELYLGEQESWVAPGQTYAIQGEVLRTGELDQEGYIGVGRLLITCCFADSTAVVCFVKVEDPDAYTPGTWVRVMGEVEKGVPLSGSALALKGALTVVRNEKLSLRAADVSEAKVEGVPFIFDMRTQQPYAY